MKRDEGGVGGVGVGEGPRVTCAAEDVAGLEGEGGGERKGARLEEKEHGGGDRGHRRQVPRHGEVGGEGEVGEGGARKAGEEDLPDGVPGGAQEDDGDERREEHRLGTHDRAGGDREDGGDEAPGGVDDGRPEEEAGEARDVRRRLPRAMKRTTARPSSATQTRKSAKSTVPAFLPAPPRCETPQPPDQR